MEEIRRVGALRRSDPFMTQGMIVIRTAELETVVGVTTKQLPKNDIPEIAFAGRSNVGKSSLINALLNRKSLARTSGTPGKTQTMNYYKVNQDCYFVDLPGYGYAKVNQELKQKWGKMTDRYFKTSKQLRCIFLLVDIRHKPTGDDVMMMNWIRASGLRMVVVATKLDKLKRSQVQKSVKLIKETLDLKEEKLILFSAETKSGREEIWEEIEDILQPKEAVEGEALGT